MLPLVADPLALHRPQRLPRRCLQSALLLAFGARGEHFHQFVLIAKVDVSGGGLQRWVDGPLLSHAVLVGIRIHPREGQSPAGRPVLHEGHAGGDVSVKILSAPLVGSLLHRLDIRGDEGPQLAEGAACLEVIPFTKVLILLKHREDSVSAVAAGRPKHLCTLQKAPAGLKACAD